MDAGRDLSFDGVVSLCDAAMEELQQRQLHSHSSTALSLPPSANLFTEMNATERKEYWSNEENRLEFFNKVLPMLDGALCTICENGAIPEEDKRCDTCGIFFHAMCVYTNEEEEVHGSCLACRITQQKSNNRQSILPQCFMCCHPTRSIISPLVRAHFNSKPTAIKNVEYCHALCGFWTGCKIRNNESKDTTTTIDCSRLREVKAGKYLRTLKDRCALCGLYQGAKVCCELDSKDCVRHRKDKKAFYHVTCARQAGLQVDINIMVNDPYKLRCFKHVSCAFVLRAHFENFKVIEVDRSPDKKLFDPKCPMTWKHASTLLHYAISNIMRTLGWAWRWAEWWVELGDNWEPLLEDDQDEEDIMNEEVMSISTPESRCIDARKCRLAAFGAALRNRDYDTEDGVDQESLERALVEVLRTKSLVGPMEDDEIDFFITWLVLAYRSKSPLLGFGDDKTPVATDAFCIHQDDGSPKYILGSRPLPGNVGPPNSVLQHVEDVDDFLKAPPNQAGLKASTRKRKQVNDPIARRDEPSAQVKNGSMRIGMVGQIYDGLQSSTKCDTISDLSSSTTLIMKRHDVGTNNNHKSNAGVTCGVGTDVTLTSVQKWNDEFPMVPAHASGAYGIRRKVDNSANWRDDPIHPVKNGSAGTETASISGRGICNGLPRISAALLGFGSDKVPVAEHTCDGTLFPESELGSSPLPGKVESKTLLPQITAGRNKCSQRKSNTLREGDCNKGDSGSDSGIDMTIPVDQSGSNKIAKKDFMPPRQDREDQFQGVATTAVVGSNLTGGVGTGVTLVSVQKCLDGTPHSPTHSSLSNGTAERGIISEPTSAANLSDEDALGDGENDTNSAGRSKSYALVNGTSRKSNISIGCKLQLLKEGKQIFIEINGPRVYDRKVAELVDLLVADLNHEDIELSNQAFTMLECHRDAYIAERGPNLYLTIAAKFLNKQRGRDSYNSKLALFLDNLLKVHHDDINFINQSFDVLEWHKEAYLAAKGPDGYNSMVAEVVDRLLAGAVEHDDDEVIIDKFNLLKRYKDAYVAARGLAIYQINVEGFMRKLL